MIIDLETIIIKNDYLKAVPFDLYLKSCSMKKFENSVRHYSPESASQIIRESDFEFVTAPMNTVIDVIILRFEPNLNIQDK